MNYNFTTAQELLSLCTEHDVSISEIALRYEMQTSESTQEEIFSRSRSVLAIMAKAIHSAIESPMQSDSQLVNGDAFRLHTAVQKNKQSMLMSETALHAMLYAIATNENNACNGCIAACPTAGSAGIVPSALFSVRDRYTVSEDELIRGLLHTSAIGMIIAANATLSGAEGGCQSEDGSAAAMAASAITEMRGGTVQQCLNAAALSLKNVLGLVCDPIGGLVEVPCVKRTAFMVMNAFTASDLAMCGIESTVPFDEVVDAMRRIGQAMPSSLRETAQGGLATTATGMRVKEAMKKAEQHVE